MTATRQIAAADMAAEGQRVAEAIRSASLRPAMQKCYEAVKHSTADSFDTATSPDGTSWPPRKEPTGDWPLLVKSGALAAAASGEGEGHVAEIGDREMSTGVQSDVIQYAAAQNYGYPPNNLPPREYLGADEPALDECGEAIADAGLAAIWGAA